jgi:nitrogen-specific signal transduction histidine kinase/CheY-like chemotaxis protein
MKNKRCILTAIYDLTEQKRIEAKLQQAQKMEAIGTLAGGIAHDFNNILSAIIGYTELSQIKLPEDNNVLPYLDGILKASNRARELVQQILTFSRQTELELRPVQVNIIVKEALKLLRASLPTTIEIQQDIKCNSLVMGDPTKLHQVLMNICTNASHAMRENGGVLDVNIVNIEVDNELSGKQLDLKPGRYVKLTISDTGQGMPPNVLDRIFDPFYTTKEKSEGTGMGLSVVHGIVKSYSGTVSVYSEPGKGSTFNVFLPTIDRGLKSEIYAEDPIPTGDEYILFVDDEPAIVDIGKQTIESLGYDVTTRTSSIDALELFKEHPNKFDLVITDMTMPKLTGEDLAKELIGIRSDIPIILCTGFSVKIDEQKAATMGIRALVLKPMLIRDIAKTIRKVLDK